jgi:hypothetical protein
VASPAAIAQHGFDLAGQVGGQAVSRTAGSRIWPADLANTGAEAREHHKDWTKRHGTTPQQLAPPLTGAKSVSPAHWMRHTAVLAQLTEQPPVQVTSQVEPSLHEMLPLAPSVTAHEASTPQSMLHESPHAPLHVASLPHAREQLPPQVCVVKSHEVAASQAQLVPVQAGGGFIGETPPQLVAKANRRIASP